MDIAPSSKVLTKSRSIRSRHGSVKGGPALRSQSPDSACEHDGEWLSGATSGQEDMTSDLSEEGIEKSRKCAGRKNSIKESATLRRKSGEMVVAKGAAGQDSDVDSGIVACRKPGQRIGSTSSADTDSSQESRRRIEYSPPLQKSDLPKSRSSAGSLRIGKHSSCLTQSAGPVKGDHTALKECNRRPPTPLSVFPDSNHCVRFDEQLQLSEQNIRRSCRKLFATLYAQRFSYPTQRSHSLLHDRSNPGSTRIRSRTAPELELCRYSPVSLDGQYRHGRNYKENVGPVEGRRMGNLPWSSRPADIGLGSKITPYHILHHKLQIHQSYTMDGSESVNSRTTSMDSGVGSFKSSGHCTCHSRNTSETLPSSQFINSPSQCTCRVCNCTPQLPHGHDRITGLVKSNSCSTLSSALSHQSRPQLTQFPPRTLRKFVSQNDEDTKVKPLQKTASCSSLTDRASGGLLVSNVPVYSDNMVHVYAHIASVVPDELKAAKSNPLDGRRAKTLSRLRYTSENVYDSIRSAKSDVPRCGETRADSISGNTEIPQTSDSLRTAYESSNSCSESQRDIDSKSINSTEIYSQISETSNASLRRKSPRESMRNKSVTCQRPKNVGVVSPNCGPNPVYLKSALKKSTQAAMQHVNELAKSQTSVNNGAITEVEYAVVDKSKKNRFASLPALNGCSASTTVDNDDKDPPIPPKKLLHKSDFSLYRSRSSSPKKTLLERMQTLTKNAKSAIQKAFSTERIYRPEREERIEANGQKGIQRSRSFIRSLTGSFRKKKRNRNPVAEVVPQASSNPDWDEQPSGPNSPNHVRGQLLQLNLDGSQVIELAKPQSKPYGFFVARGRVRNSKGVFVSRMRDQETQKQLAGLLDIGDEILEIDGSHVKDADIMEVNNLMANKNTLLLTVLPYICRKDI